ncbi:hypothetical protein ACH5RR_028476 [Cinchona calisaya]|uniref:Cytochrome P450 n=1 Tax=Cinchona calisaya TaxID=153742 RepID=A0ABD2YNW6_9GENT
MMLDEAKTKPINLSDDIVPRIVPFVLETIKKYGRDCFIWLGPYPSMIILEPELLKEIFMKNFLFGKPPTHPLGRLLAEGLVMANGDEWIKHRKIINSAFHLEKLKVTVILNEVLRLYSPAPSLDRRIQEGTKLGMYNFPARVLLTLPIILLRHDPKKWGVDVKEFKAERFSEGVSNATKGQFSFFPFGWGARASIGQNFAMIEVKLAMAMILQRFSFELSPSYAHAPQSLQFNLSTWIIHRQEDNRRWIGAAIKQYLDLEFKTLDNTHEIFYRVRMKHIAFIKVTMILNKVLRLYPPALALNRRVDEETKVGQLSLPAGVMLWLQVILLHHDGEIWGDDAKEFRPGRFSQGLPKDFCFELSPSSRSLHCIYFSTSACCMCYCSYNLYMELESAEFKVVEAKKAGEIAKRTRSSRKFLQIIGWRLQTNGRKTYVWYAPEPAIFLQEPEFLREAAQSIHIFHKPQPGQFTKLLTPGLASYNGDKWAKHRKLINPAFNGEKLKNMLPFFYLSANEMMRKWEDIVSPKGSCELDVWPNLQSMTSDAISRSIWQFLPTKRNRRMSQIAIREIINSRINAMRAGESCDDDLLGRLLKSNSQEIAKHGDRDFGMTTEEERARNEILQLFGSKKTDFDGLNRLKLDFCFELSPSYAYAPYTVFTLQP